MPGSESLNEHNAYAEWVAGLSVKHFQEARVYEKNVEIKKNITINKKKERGR